jgi:heat shock protein HslJ
MFSFPLSHLSRLALVALLLTSLAACGAGAAAQPTAQPTAAPATQAPIEPSPSAEPAPGAGLDGTRWQLVEYGSPESPTKALAQPPVGLSFELGQMSGSASCNSFGAQYSVDGAEIRIEDFPMTMMACDDPIMQQESAYVRLLTGARHWRIEGDELVIEGEGGLLRYRRELVPPAAALVGTAWRLESFELGAVAQSVIAGSTVTLNLDQAGAVSGSGGCNSYNGQYEVEGSTIKIQNIIMTEMACAEQAVTQQEGAYLKALGQATAYTLDGQTLRVDYAGGALVFRAQ